MRRWSWQGKSDAEGCSSLGFDLWRGLFFRLHSMAFVGKYYLFLHLRANKACGLLIVASCGSTVITVLHVQKKKFHLADSSWSPESLSSSILTFASKAKPQKANLKPHRILAEPWLILHSL